MNQEAFEELIQGIVQGKLISATLSSPRHKQESIIKISLRQVTLKGAQMIQMSEQGEEQVLHRNLSHKECAQYIEKAFGTYMQGIFALTDGHYHVLVSKHHKMTVIKKPATSATAACALPHNRKKNYVLPEGRAVPFLVALGIMTENGTVIAKKYDKFRQINRFLEMVRDVIDELPKGRCLEILDFGCGKAYLTFALYHYLHVIEKRSVHIRGWDLKKEVITYCQALAKELRLEGLTFAVGDINNFESSDAVDLMISLHACNTATDAALEKAVLWGARVILCVPCCQQELYSQVDSPTLETLLQHGILKERFAALATDAARADLLTMLGYEVQILEFIDMEHTPKNLLLRCVKGSVSKEKQRQAKERYLAFKQALNICPSLERRFSMLIDKL